MSMMSTTCSVSPARSRRRCSVPPSRRRPPAVATASPSRQREAEGRRRPDASSPTVAPGGPVLRKYAAFAALLTVVVQCDCIPNYANWGGVTALYKRLTGVLVPPDMKGSSVAMAALDKERAHPIADVAYYSGAIGYEAARRGLHAPYKPRGWAQVPPALKDPNGLWFTVHTGAIALIVNTK